MCVIGGKKHGSNLNIDHYPIGFADIIRKYNITNMDEAKRTDILWDINNGRTLCIECHKKTNNFANKKI